MLFRSYWFSFHNGIIQLGLTYAGVDYVGLVAQVPLPENLTSTSTTAQTKLNTLASDITSNNLSGSLTALTSRITQLTTRLTAAPLITTLDTQQKALNSLSAQWGSTRTSAAGTILTALQTLYNPATGLGSVTTALAGAGSSTLSTSGPLSMSGSWVTNAAFRALDDNVLAISFTVEPQTPTVSGAGQFFILGLSSDATMSAHTPEYQIRLDQDRTFTEIGRAHV